MIETKNLYKSFNNNKVLQGVNLEIDTGETIVIIGRSGCGKSVLIKHIVGLLYPDEGYVKVEGQRVDEMTMQELYTLRRKFGFLFQGSALFDSMTVEENIALPLVESGKNFGRVELDKKVAEKLELVGMRGVQKLKPAELSGGMKKRVGLARALITDPDYIIYDEPTTGLDPATSDEISLLINEVQKKYKTSSLIITHDIECARTTANRVIMLHEGEVYQEGKLEKFERSTDTLIKSFFK